MKKLFPGSYAPSSDDYKAMWADGVFVFDTNMLLNFHRYSEDTRREFLDVVSSPQILPRIWIPYQVALEYHRNLDAVRYEQVQECQSLKQSIEESRKSLRAGDHKKRTDALLKLVNELLADAEQQYHHPERGILIERIAHLFDGKVGPEWDSKKLKDVYKDGEERYAQRVPPGFKDASSKKGDDRFGDLVIWLQIIEEAQQRKKPIILVTDDVKEDWWLRIGGKTIGPQPALKNEIYRKAGVPLHMYSGDRFLEEARKVLRQSVRDETVAEVKQVRVDQEKHHRSLVQSSAEAAWRDFLSKWGDKLAEHPRPHVIKFRRREFEDQLALVDALFNEQRRRDELRPIKDKQPGQPMPPEQTTQEGAVQDDGEEEDDRGE